MSALRTLIAAAIAAVLVLGPAAAASAAPEPAWDSVQRIALVRADGTRVPTDEDIDVSNDADTAAHSLGDLFAGELLIPGAEISASFTILRLGGGASALTLGLPSTTELDSPLARDLEIAVSTPTTQASGPFRVLLDNERLVSLGVGSEETVPVTITVTLPASSTNATRQGIVPFVIRATAADPLAAAPVGVPHALDGAPHQITGVLAATGFTVRDLALGAGALFALGLGLSLVPGARRRRGAHSR